MHKLINIIVFAKDELEAVDVADVTLSDLCDARIFDYYNMFEGNGRAEERWGNVPKCIDGTSKLGIKTLEEALKFTLVERMDDIKNLRKLFDKYSDEDLLNGEDKGTKLTLFSWWISNRVGFLYDQWGDKISSSEEFRRIFLEKSVKNIYVVPADIHY